MKNYAIQTYGCAMNTADTERFRTILHGMGLTEIDNVKKADLIIFNTCSVREKAEDRIYGLKPLIHELKKSKPELITVLTGCMARRRIGSEEHEHSREEILRRKAEWLDIIIETQDFHTIGDEFKRLGVDIHQPTSKTPRYNRFLDVKREPFHAFSAGVTISHGCDHLCSYCIVPYARGREICRRLEPILEETDEAIQNGAKEIVLLGQTVNRWINPTFKNEYINDNRLHTKIDRINANLMDDNKDQPHDFLQLLQKIDFFKGNFWLTFMSSHPNYFTDQLIEFVADSVRNDRHIRPYIHLALQSGNDDILRRMRRNHTIEEFKQKVHLMKKLIPGVAITTDIIVGFPSETALQFQDTLDVCQELEFDQIYISEYSEREGTGSSFMTDDISSKEKAKRKDTLNSLLKETALKNNKKMLKTRQKVLVNKKLNKNTYQGRTANNKLIRVLSDSEISVGEFVSVEVSSVTAWALEGNAL